MRISHKPKAHKLDEEQTKVALKEHTVDLDLLFLELVEQVKHENEASWEIARVLSRLYNEYGVNDYQITERLNELGLKVGRPTVTMYRLTYEYYCKKLKLCDYARRINITTAYRIRAVFNRVGAGRETIKEVIKEIEGMSANEAIRYVRRRFDTDEGSFTTAGITVDPAVADQFRQVVEKFSQVAEILGEPKPSYTTVLEIIVGPFLDASVEELVQYWRRVHGEEEA